MGENETRFTKEFDGERLKKEQIFQLVISFVISACLIVPPSFFVAANYLFLFPIFYGVMYFIWWPFILIYAIWAMRRPLRKMEIDLEAGTITLNDDVYKIHEQQVYFEVESGTMKFLHYGCLTLRVVDGSDKKIATYFVGPSFGKYSKQVRDSVNKLLPLISTALMIKGSREEVVKEMEESWDVVRVEFPANSIRNSLYKTCNIILVFTIFAYVFSYLPPRFYENEPLLPEGFRLLRGLSVLMMFVCVAMVLSYYRLYKRLAKTIEISSSKIKVNDKEFIMSEIMSIRMFPGVDNPDYKDEGQSWLLITSRERVHRYYLGQMKNKDCFEPRRKLRNTLDEFFTRKTPK
jgi:hypothetical protein